MKAEEMYNKIEELFLEPQNILQYTDESYCEMTKFEQGFLCSLIKNKIPSKVLEVGVAGGGTTCVIMKCLELINPSAKMWSVDLANECYRREGKQTGYQLLEVKDQLTNYKNHNFLLGSMLPNRIDEIGDNIDFVILDTTHLMPGELLDFLVVLPHLSNEAIVVLHDVTLNLSGSGGYSYATKILLDAVTGDKFYNYKTSPNIAAFRINNNTIKNIANVFSALSITWQYKLSQVDLMSYRDAYVKSYNKECIELFDYFTGQNGDRVERQKGEKRVEEKKLSSLKKMKKLRQIGRVDIKNNAYNLDQGLDNLIIEKLVDTDIKITSPEWFCKNGKGYVIESEEGYLKVRCTVIGDGELEIRLRGVDYKENGQRVPIYVKFTSLCMNEKDILLKPIKVCHDEPFTYKVPVNNNDVLIIAISWRNVQEADGRS